MTTPMGSVPFNAKAAFKEIKIAYRELKKSNENVEKMVEKAVNTSLEVMAKAFTANVNNPKKFMGLVSEIKKLNQHAVDVLDKNIKKIDDLQAVRGTVGTLHSGLLEDKVKNEKKLQTKLIQVGVAAENYKKVMIEGLKEDIDKKASKITEITDVRELNKEMDSIKEMFNKLLDCSESRKDSYEFYQYFNERLEYCLNYLNDAKKNLIEMNAADKALFDKAFEKVKKLDQVTQSYIKNHEAEAKKAAEKVRGWIPDYAGEALDSLTPIISPENLFDATKDRSHFGLSGFIHSTINELVEEAREGLKQEQAAFPETSKGKGRVKNYKDKALLNLKGWILHQSWLVNNPDLQKGIVAPVQKNLGVLAKEGNFEELLSATVGAVAESVKQAIEVKGDQEALVKKLTGDPNEDIATFYKKTHISIQNNMVKLLDRTLLTSEQKRGVVSRFFSYFMDIKARIVNRVVVSVLKQGFESKDKETFEKSIKDKILPSFEDMTADEIVAMLQKSSPAVYEWLKNTQVLENIRAAGGSSDVIFLHMLDKTFEKAAEILEKEKKPAVTTAAQRSFWVASKRADFAKAKNEFLESIKSGVVKGSWMSIFTSPLVFVSDQLSLTGTDEAWQTRFVTPLRKNWEEWIKAEYNT